jgi:transposase
MTNQEIIRLEQYCQIVNEITGSDRYLVVGIDIGKDTHHAFMGTATGISLYRKLIFKNNIEGFEKLLKITNQVKEQHGLTEVVFGCEPTGNYYKPLGHHLIRCARHMVLVAGQAVKNNRVAIDGRWDKNDTKDAANIADLISRGRCLYYDSPSQQIMDLKELLSLRKLLKREEHRLKMRIRNNILTKYFPELDRFYSACESEALAIVRKCLDPRIIGSMEFDQFINLITHNRRGVAQKLRLQKIHQAAIESVGCPVGCAVELEAEILTEKLDHVRSELDSVCNLIEEICLGFLEYSYLMTIPGFGPFVTATVLGAIGDPFRFKNRRQLLKMAGFDLSAQRSGKSASSAIPVISKKGNSDLRYALFQAAKVASSRTEPFRTYFANSIGTRRREKGIVTKMRVKLAAKMLVIAWTLMKHKEDFNPEYVNID